MEQNDANDLSKIGFEHSESDRSHNVVMDIAGSLKILEDKSK